MALHGFSDRFQRRFGLQLGWRMATLVLAGAACVWALVPPTLPATALVLAAAALALLASVQRLVRQTNLELARLTDLLRHGDLAQTFEPQASDSGFVELSRSMEGLVGALRAQMQQRQAALAHWQSLVEQVPTPLLTVDDDSGAVEALNHAARRLVDHHGAALTEGLRCRDVSFHLDLSPPDDAAQRLRVTQSRVVHQGRAQRLLALQPVQADIAQAQLALAGDLVRVLSHEVMNSLTPVTSLAGSAADAAALLPAGDAATRVQTATAAVARRAAGLLQFVQSYRQLAQPPALQPRELPAAPLAQDLATLFESEWPRDSVALRVQLQTPELQLHADAVLLEQVLLNLLRNAAQAALGHAAAPVVELRLAPARSGRTLIEVHDNGPGIPEALREEVFLPFFTTKAGGSGIGLSLARQAALAHGGSIQALASPLGGACLRLVL